MSIISLPLEIEYTIIERLSDDTYALQICALVSRTWSAFSQRLLFRNAQLDLRTSKKLAKVLNDLTSMPHFQTLVRAVTIPERCVDNVLSSPGHMSRLTLVLSLLPNLTKVVFSQDVGSDDKVATRSYLDLIPNVLGNAPLVELDIVIFSVEAFLHLFGILAGTNIKRVTLAGIVSCRKLNLEPTHQRLRIPSLEYIRFKVDGSLREEFHRCIVRNFDIPNLKQCEIGTDYVDQLRHWQGTLRQGFPPVGVLKLKLAFRIPYIHVPDIALTGLYFHHVHLKVTSGFVIETCKVLEWWCNTFRALCADSNAPIHFTELTLTFPVSRDIDVLQLACRLLDDSLAHPMFSAVRCIYFKDSKAFISDAVADKIRLAFPQLTSRGVLSLV